MKLRWFSENPNERQKTCARSLSNSVSSRIPQWGSQTFFVKIQHRGVVCIHPLAKSVRSCCRRHGYRTLIFVQQSIQIRQPLDIVSCAYLPIHSASLADRGWAVLPRFMLLIISC